MADIAPLRESRPDLHPPSRLACRLFAGGVAPRGRRRARRCRHRVRLSRPVSLLTVILERKGLGRIQNRLRPQPRGPLRLVAAHSRRHQGAHQGRHCSLQRRCSGAFSCAARAGGHGLHGLRGAAHGPQHGAGRHGRRPAVLFRHGRGHGAFGFHGRLVEPQ